MAVETTSGYALLNQSSSKDLIYVLEIEGLGYVFGTTVIQQALGFGASGATYGAAGLVYGGTLPFGGASSEGAFNKDKQRPYLNVDSGGLTISQKVDPWSGKASIGTLTYKLTDVNGEVLRAVSPGTGSEPLIKRAKFYVGFEGLSFPSEYIRLTQGLISEIQCEPGLITIVTSDPNLIRKQKLFEKTQSSLSAAVNAVQTTIPVDTTAGFFTLVPAPGSDYPEPGHQVGLLVDNEIMLYTTDPTGTSFVGVTRGALGTAAATHSQGASVTPVFQHEGNPLLIACKVMLSGWAGASITGVPLVSVVTTGDPDVPSVPSAYCFGVDLKAQYGLIEGDFVSVTGTKVPRNGIFERQIISFFDIVGVKNAGVVLQLESAAAAETESTGVASFRSQFDVYPIGCGLEMDMQDVDTARHVNIATQFLTTEVANFNFVQTDELDSGKDFCETELYLPCGAFSLTRSGQCSVALTTQPLPGSTLVSINADNVIDPDKAKLTRGVTSRKFYNRVDFSLDYDPVGQEFLSFVKYIDSDSLEAIPYREYLQVESKGMRSDRNAQALIDRAQRKIFERYARAAQTITFKATWSLGATLEAGDVVLVEDQQTLNLPNLDTGTRGLGTQLWEILEKSTDLKSGVSTITMISAAGTVTDRFGLVGPSSEIDAGVSLTQFRIRDSFGAIYPTAESKKWETFVGYKVAVFSPDYSFYQETTLLSIDQQDPYLLTVSPLLSVPASGFVIQLAGYYGDRNADPLAKLVHAYLSPKVDITAGFGTTLFTVAPQDVGRFFVGAKVEIHTSNAEVSLLATTVVTGISGASITVQDVGFQLTAGLYAEGIGFSSDQTEYYRFYS